MWKAVLEAPTDEGCLYNGGTYLLLIQYDDNYPVTPPTVRFHTPIRHVNVNSYGRICHGILSRDWSVSWGRGGIGGHR